MAIVAAGCASFPCLCLFLLKLIFAISVYTHICRTRNLFIYITITRQFYPRVPCTGGGSGYYIYITLSDVLV